MTNTAKKTIQNNLQELQQEINLLKNKKQAALTLKTELEQKINDLYAKPLNARQMMQFVMAVVDERSEVYKNNMVSSGFLERSYLSNNRPLSFDDFEQIQGRARVRGERSSPSEANLLYKFELIKTYDTETHTWMAYFFGDLIKEKIADIYGCKYGKKALEALESIEDRNTAINDTENQLMKLDEEIKAISDEIHTASEPVRKFMQGCS
jgi:archaellum component FlaC